MQKFSCLRDALDLCVGNENRVFHTEDPRNGIRKFLVAPGSEFFEAEEFFKFYSRLPARHFYEHIFADKPCRLYFDLEYFLPLNPEFDIGDFYSQFYSILDYLLKKLFDISFNGKTYVVLDSSTPEKFSNHLIVLTEKLFASNADVGYFAKVVAEYLRFKKVGLVRDSHRADAMILDLGVYKSNQSLRLFLSSKYGKSAFLKLAGVSNDDEGFSSDFDIFTKTLVIPVKYKDFDIFDMSRVRVAPKKSIPHPILPTYNGPSPYGFIDDFLLEQIRLYSPKASIRSWTISDKNVLKYDFFLARYCYRIGRAHRSNHVFYLVFLEKGLIYQKCYDPECKNYYKMFHMPSRIKDRIPTVQYKPPKNSITYKKSFSP